MSKFSDKSRRLSCLFISALVFSILFTGCSLPLSEKKDKTFTVAGVNDNKDGDTDTVQEKTSEEDTDTGLEDDGNGENTGKYSAGYFESDVMSPTISFDENKLEDWQKAFYQIILSVRGESEQLLDGKTISVPSVGYFIYDADDDGTPELFVKFGTCEADFFYKIYKFENNAAVEAVCSFCGHTSFYSMPEKGFITSWAHMGYMGVSKVQYNGHELSGESVYEADLTQNENYAEYKNIYDIVPGAEHLTFVSTDVFLPLITYVNTPSTSDGLSDEEVKARSESIINDGGNVFAATGDNYGETKGNVDFGTYLTKGYASPYNDYKVAGYDFYDMNSDGQKECIIRVKNKEFEDSDGSIIVLSFQNGTAYVYSLNYTSASISFNADGSYTDNSEYGAKHRFYFYKDEAFETFLEK